MSKWFPGWNQAAVRATKDERHVETQSGEFQRTFLESELAEARAGGEAHRAGRERAEQEAAALARTIQELEHRGGVLRAAVAEAEANWRNRVALLEASGVDAARAAALSAQRVRELEPLNLELKEEKGGLEKALEAARVELQTKLREQRYTSEEEQRGTSAGLEAQLRAANENTQAEKRRCEDTLRQLHEAEGAREIADDDAVAEHGVAAARAHAEADRASREADAIAGELQALHQKHGGLVRAALTLSLGGEDHGASGGGGGSPFRGESPNIALHVPRPDSANTTRNPERAGEVAETLHRSLDESRSRFQDDLKRMTMDLQELHTLPQPLAVRGGSRGGPDASPLSHSRSGAPPRSSPPARGASPPLDASHTHGPRMSGAEAGLSPTGGGELQSADTAAAVRVELARERLRTLEVA
ncbi:hypothetical protein T484DRAFT_1784621 [Baffinella frigidus]|nr:hypothetical protein T484DRAFT_1784621 [Cryptophyta sp. CCMP2293]